jgi:hypothetical protein
MISDRNQKETHNSSLEICNHPSAHARSEERDPDYYEGHEESQDKCLIHDGENSLADL